MYLQEHVETALILSERVACHFANEILETFPSFLNKRILENSIVTPERETIII